MKRFTVCLLLTACQTHPQPALTAGARSSVTAAQTATAQARAASQRSSAQIAATRTEIAAAKTDMQRVEGKDELIREWEARQIIRHHPPMSTP